MVSGLRQQDEGQRHFDDHPPEAHPQRDLRFAERQQQRTVPEQNIGGAKTNQQDHQHREGRAGIQAGKYEWTGQK